MPETVGKLTTVLASTGTPTAVEMPETLFKKTLKKQ
jgi:hypothetical protein